MYWRWGAIFQSTYSSRKYPYWVLFLVQGPGSHNGDVATVSCSKLQNSSSRKVNADVWGLFISRHVYTCMYSPLSWQRRYFSLESMVQSMRNQDEQKESLHVLSVTCNPQFYATLKHLSYRIILHLEIQCPLWPWDSSQQGETSEE